MMADLCIFDGLQCEFGFRCLADLSKPVGSVARCSRFVFAKVAFDSDMSVRGRRFKRGERAVRRVRH